MRFVFGEKVYDTEKATYLAEVKKWYRPTNPLIRMIYGENVGRDYNCDLYVSEKGRYLLVRKNEANGYTGELITELEARRLLAAYAPEVYAERFGEPEEL